MPRSEFQPGPATDHYHDTLGPDLEEGGGSVSVTDGSTTVTDVTTLSVTGATISDEGAGEAGLALPVFSRTVELTNADIKALAVPTAFTLVPAPGVGKVLDFLRMQFAVRGVDGSPYTNIAVNCYLVVKLGLVELAYANNSGLYLGNTLITNLLGQPVGSGGWDTLFLSPGLDVGNPDLLSQPTSEQSTVNVANQPLTIKIDGGSGALTGGDSTTIMRVKTIYTVLDLSS